MPDLELAATPLALGRRWAVRGDVLARVADAHRLLERSTYLQAAKPQARRAIGQRAGGAVAVIPLTGVLTPRGSFLSMLFGGGGGGLMDFRDAFREAVASPDVGAIVIDVDSPGGLVDLVPETAAEVRAAQGSKPIVAVANTMAASGAYWIAAQADELVVTPSGDVGSVGVYVVHEDWSAANAEAGIAVTYISAGKYKVEGNPDQPLSEDAQAFIQQEVDDLYTMFVSDVAAGRGVSEQTVVSTYGEGRTLNAQRALAAGMVDRVDTLESVIGGLLQPSASGGARALAGRMALARARAEDPESDPEPTPDLPADPPPVEDTPPAPVPVADEPEDEPQDEDENTDEPDTERDAPVEPSPEERAAIAALLTS